MREEGGGRQTSRETTVREEGGGRQTGSGCRGADLVGLHLMKNGSTPPVSTCRNVPAHSRSPHGDSAAISGWKGLRASGGDAHLQFDRLVGPLRVRRCFGWRPRRTQWLAAARRRCRRLQHRPDTDRHTAASSHQKVSPWCWPHHGRHESPSGLAQAYLAAGAAADGAGPTQLSAGSRPTISIGEPGLKRAPANSESSWPYNIMHSGSQPVRTAPVAVAELAAVSAAVVKRLQCGAVNCARTSCSRH